MNWIIVFLLFCCQNFCAAEQTDAAIIDAVLKEWIAERQSKILHEENQLGTIIGEDGKRVNVSKPETVIFHPGELQIANRQFMEALRESDDLRLKALFVQGKLLHDYRFCQNTLKQIAGKPENQAVLKEDYWKNRLALAERRVLALKRILNEKEQ